ncbi:cupin domain-containing protein [Marinicella sp. S1101]|uniref:cupin domain-containing protein n=1 Tax=Marinicella marina TaxID=2996016 RepID=UPI002260F7B8|nr:cupin domain-containing protein [Marinicella marina]MCX7553200.1 cupin domain-containing protein [Marinicella marina]MDJ1138932.1 cupin domain-containing protein [Marinicella marina]
MRNPINLKHKAQSIDEHWSPKVVAAVDDNFVKVAKVKGEFTWHEHEEDEFFMVLDGTLKIEMEAETVTLKQGEVYVVPKGVRHKPSSSDECLIMLFEKQSTLHTGKTKSALTKDIKDQLSSS